MKARHELLNEALRLRDEINQLYTDVAHWNGCVRKPDEAMIDPDPGYQLGAIRRRITDRMQDELLCVYSSGPDEFIPCEGLAEADDLARELNAISAKFPDLGSTSLVQVWPFSLEAHRDASVRLKKERA